MITFSHVGIAVSKGSPLRALLGLLEVPTHDTTVPRESLAVTMVPLGARSARLELLETENPDSTVGRFLARHGPGIHHVCLGVPHGALDAICERLRANGYRLLLEKNELGAEGAFVNFVHPKSTGGVLLELQEQSRDGEP